MKHEITTFSGTKKLIKGSFGGIITRDMVRKHYDKFSGNGLSRQEVFAKISLKTGLTTERIRQILTNDYELRRDQ